MHDNTFIKYTRSLHTNKIFKSLSFEYRHIFMTILVNMAFKPIQLNDHGVLIDLKPGQFMTTIRELVKLCDEKGIDRSKVERALTMFEKVGFSRQETRHRKTIITIKESSICESLNCEVETINETKSRQDRDKIETQKKKDKKEEKEKTTPPTPSKGDRVVVFYDCLKENKELTEDEKECLMQYSENRVKLALEFSKIDKPKTTLIQLLVWHCKQAIPPRPTGKRFTDQQRMAFDFNSYLLSIGQELLYHENLKNIEDGAYMLIPLNGCPTPITLNTSLQLLKKDFEDVKNQQRKLKYG